MKLILPIMGFNFLISTVIKDEARIDIKKKDYDYYHIKAKSLKARLYESSKGFVVVKGSQAKKGLSNSIRENYIRMRERLIKNGTLVEEGVFYIFTEDTIFPSLSSASNIVLGRQSAGPIQWVNDENKTYKYIEEKKMNESRPKPLF